MCHISEIDVGIYMAFIIPHLSDVGSLGWFFFFCRNVGWYCTRLPRVDTFYHVLFVEICSLVSYCNWLYYNGKSFTFSQVPFTIFLIIVFHYIFLYKNMLILITNHEVHITGYVLSSLVFSYFISNISANSTSVERYGPRLFFTWTS